MIIRISFNTDGMAVLKALFGWTTWFSAFESWHWACWNCERYRRWPHMPDITIATYDWYKLTTWLNVLELKLDGLVSRCILVVMLVLGVSSLGAYDVYAQYEGELVVAHQLHAHGMCEAVSYD